jgi:hypothetical protein
MNNHAGVIVLLADASQRHVVIEVASRHASTSELAALARAVSDRVGFELAIYAVLPTCDHPRAVEQARQLLRFNQELSDAA